MENKKPNNVLRVLVVGGIIAILIFLSIGIVRVIPRALNALASASVSIGSLFNNTSTSTDSGFIVSTTTPSQPSYNASSTDDGITISDIIHPATSTRPTTGGPNYIPSTTATYTGNPDLAVTILSRGIVDRNSGQYIETNNFNTNDTVIVKFKIENRGTGITGPWNLRVNMPANNNADRARSSNGNPSLPAGSAVTGQAIFDQPMAGTNTVFNVAVEPQTSVVELSDSNNIATTYFNVSGYNNNGGGTIPNTGYQPDLSGQIIAVGILDGNNNFIATNNPRMYDRVAIKFRVSNTGSTATGPWNFRLSFGNGQDYTSYESGIAGNSSLTYTVGVQNVQQGYNTMNIYLDSNNNVVESNEGNNVISTNFNTVY